MKIPVSMGFPTQMRVFKYVRIERGSNEKTQQDGNNQNYIRQIEAFLCDHQGFHREPPKMKKRRDVDGWNLEINEKYQLKRSLRAQPREFTLACLMRIQIKFHVWQSHSNEQNRIRFRHRQNKIWKFPIEAPDARTMKGLKPDYNVQIPVTTILTQISLMKICFTLQIVCCKIFCKTKIWLPPLKIHLNIKSCSRPLGLFTKAKFRLSYQPKNVKFV